MVIVSKIDNEKTIECINEQIKNEITQEEVEAELTKREEGEFVKQDVEFIDHSNKVRYGFYMDAALKFNLDNYFIKAVKKKWDGNLLCLSENTSIKTPTGDIKLKDIKASEVKVVAYDFITKQEVSVNSNIFNTGNKKVYEVTLADNSTVKATEEHIFFIKENGKTVERKLKDITVGDELICINLQEYSQKVTSIKYVGTEECYDLQVPKHHNFILSNNILSHNCTGMEGCLVGDSMININRCSLGRPYKLSYIYQQFKDRNKPWAKGKAWNFDKPTFVRSFNGKTIQLHKINDVVFSGEKKVWKIVLANGREITATKTHKVMTKTGWVELQHLDENSKIMCDNMHPRRGNKRSYKLSDINVRTHFHPYPSKVDGTYCAVEVHRLIYEARLNDLDFREFLDIIWNDEEVAKELKFINPKIDCIHHIDGNHYNNSVDNLRLINKKEHSRTHTSTNTTFFGCGIPTYSRLIKKEYIGTKKTYDIICDDPHHNFVANGLVVHNSGKSTAAFTIAKYVDPTFPGKRLDDGTGRRSCARIVFTQKQFMDAVDNSKPGKCIVWDEMVLGGLASDSCKEAQKVLIKKMVTIRKKRLYIIFVLPSIFMLRMYFAVFRSRALIHFYSPDGIDRGYFKFYSYDTKRKLYIRGKKEFNQEAQKSDFIGRTTNTEGYFFDIKEYDAKKEAAIQQITEEPMKNKEKKNVVIKGIKDDRSMFLHCLHHIMLNNLPKMKKAEIRQFVYETCGREIIPLSDPKISTILRHAEETIKIYALEQEALRNQARENQKVKKGKSNQNE